MSEPSEHARAHAVSVLGTSLPDALDGDWRDNMVRGMLRSVAVVATLAMAYFAYHAYRKGSYWVIPLYLAAYAILLTAAFWPRLPYSVRGATALALTYGMAVLDLAESGRGGDGRVFLLVAPVLATVLFGLRTGIASLVANALIMAGFGWAFLSGRLALHAHALAAEASASAWVSNALVLTMLGVLLVFSLGYLVSHLVRFRQQCSDLVHQVRRQGEELQSQAGNLQMAAELAADRAEALQVMAGVAREAASVVGLQELLNRVVQLVSQRFGFYHTGIFVVEPSGAWAELRAASSEGGRRMLARGHRLRVGQEGIVGYVTGSGEARIALRVGQDDVFYANPDLPETQSEMAVPLVYQGQVIGALDVQDRAPDAFGEGDVTVMGALADLVVLAVRNVRLIEQVQEGLAAERRSYGDLSAEAWLDRVRRRRNVGYRYLSGDVQRLTEPQAAQAVREKADTAPLSDLALPVTARGRIIGQIRARKPDGAGAWTTPEIELLETLAEQLDTALESARLYQDTQDRSAQDRLIGEVSARIRETLDMETVLRTAADEMYQALDLDEVAIHLAEPESGDVPAAGNGQ